MKKIILIIGIIFIVILATAFVIPIIFKDDILALVDKKIDESVNAKVYYDADKFNLTLFKNFPNITVAMEDFGVVGIEEFEGDTLANIGSLDVVVNLKSLIFDDQPRISGIHLKRPDIYVKVLKNGKANYDIAKPSAEEPAPEDTTSSDFSIGIDHWEITDGKLVYDDRSLPFYMTLDQLNHNGSGDFTLDVFDMNTHTNVEHAIIRYDGVEYVSGQTFDADIAMNMDLNQFKFTFMDNKVSLNDFTLGFEGFVAIPENDIDMDIRFAARDNSFKSLLSLVPATYLEGYEGIKTEGDFDFKGFAKGTYNDNSMPAFNVTLLTENAMFQYPDLPAAVKNISIDLLVDNQDGNLDNTVVDLKKLHAELGSNPIDAKLKLEGLDKYKINADVKAKLNLAELTTMFPMEGMEMKGDFNFNLLANGVYDSVTSQIPKIDMDMSLANGFVKSADFPAPLENVRFTSSVKNETGKMAETVIRVNDFNMLLDKEPLTANLIVQNLDNYTWDASVKGTVDLEKLTKIYPIDSMTLAGIIKADIQTKGKMSDVEAERYDQLPTKGTLSIQNFSYESPDLPQGFKINTANATFNPDRIVLANFEGAAGTSDMRMNGYLTNYIGYALKDNETIKGELDFKSGKFNVNEWMTTEAPIEEDTASAPLEVIEIPKNIDFVLKSSIAEVQYDDLSLKNLKGNIIVRNGMVQLQGVNFNTLGGGFAMSGVYDTRDMAKPAFDFDMDIKDLEIKKAYATFNTVQALAPIAEKMEGKFSSDFKLAGLLAPDMSPVMNTITGGGLIKIAQASVRDSKLIAGITAVTKLKDTDQMSLNNVTVKAEIRDGRVFVEPFDLKVGNFISVVAGSNGIDGSLDYLFKMNIPAGAVGTAVNAAISKLTGAGNASSDIKVNLKVTGNYDDPKVSLAGAEAGESTTQQAKQAVSAKVEEQKKELEAELNKQKQEAEAKARAEAEKLKKEAEAKVKEKAGEVVTDSTKQEVKESLKKLFKKDNN